MKTRGKHILVISAGGHDVCRPNKTAAGFTKESARRGVYRNGGTDAARLAVHGTLDTLARSIDFTRALGSKTRCPCCGHTTRKTILSESGRRKLSRYKIKRSR